MVGYVYIHIRTYMNILVYVYVDIHLIYIHQKCMLFDLRLL